MTGRTHAEFSIGFAYLVAILIDQKFNFGLNFYLLVLLLPMIARKGSKFPDYDQNWNSISEKTITSWIVCQLIHITKGKHRSRHTHSWDICLLSLAGLYFLIEHLSLKFQWSSLNKGVLLLMLLGFYSGWISHLASDMFNGEGVYLSCLTKHKIAFVPKKLFGIHFNTGHAWEQFFYTVCKAINKVLLVLVILYPALKIGFIQTVISQIIS